MKGDAISKEKADMLESRFAVRRQAEKEKRELMENVEHLKKKGNLNKAELAKLGLGEIDEKDELPVNQSVVQTTEADAKAINSQLNKEEILSEAQPKSQTIE